MSRRTGSIAVTVSMNHSRTVDGFRTRRVPTGTLRRQALLIRERHRRLHGDRAEQADVQPLTGFTAITGAGSAGHWQSS
jgi:hypothetical protein